MREIPCHKHMWLNLPPKFLPNIFVTPLMLYMITSNGFFFINKCTLLTYGFVPDIMIILQKYKLVEYIDNFSKTSLFPLQKLWNSNATVKRKIKIFEESKIDERLNYRHWFYVLQTYTQLHWSTSGENYFLHAMNDTNLALRFISYDCIKFFIQLKYPKSEWFNINYITYIHCTMYL